MDHIENLIALHNQAFECDDSDRRVLLDILHAAYAVTRSVHIMRPATAKAEAIEHVPPSLRESIGQLRRALEEFEYVTEKNAGVGGEGID